MQYVMIHYAVALKAVTEPLQYKVGALSITQLEAPNETTKRHHNGYGFEVTSSLGHPSTQE